MSKVCAICGKGPQTGHNISHSHIRSKRRWLPNLQSAIVTVDGQSRKARVCTRCKRSNAV